MELYKAHEQWRTRPPDERFGSIRELYDVTSQRYETSFEETVSPDKLKFTISGDNNDLGIWGGERVYIPTHLAIHQTADLFGIKGEAFNNLVKYPPALANQIILQHQAMTHRDNVRLLLANESGKEHGIMRGCNTTSYARLWDWKLVKFIGDEIVGWDGSGDWKVPPARTDDRFPSGLYAGINDTFMFFVNESRRIKDGTDEGLATGFFAWNNEVGGVGFGGGPRSIGFQAFLYRMVCGNHIVWGAENVFQIRMSHIGEDIDINFKRNIRAALDKYLQMPVNNIEAAIEVAQSKQLGKNKQEVKDALGKARPKWTPSEVETIFDYGIERGVDPTNLWSFVNLATQYSHNKRDVGAFADRRASLDLKAGALLDLVLT